MSTGDCMLPSKCQGRCGAREGASPEAGGTLCCDIAKEAEIGVLARRLLARNSQATGASQKPDPRCQVLCVFRTNAHDGRL